MTTAEDMQASVLSDHPAIVYFIAPSVSGPTKIGVTTNLETRLSQIQIGCWLPLKVYSTRLAIFAPGKGKLSSPRAEFRAAAYAVEATTLSVMREMGHGLMGEWINCGPEKAITIAQYCAKGRGAGLLSLEDFAALDIWWEDPMMMRARGRIVRSLAEINEFAHAHNEKQEVG